MQARREVANDTGNAELGPGCLGHVAKSADDGDRGGRAGDRGVPQRGETSWKKRPEHGEEGTFPPAEKGVDSPRGQMATRAWSRAWGRTHCARLGVLRRSCQMVRDAQVGSRLGCVRGHSRPDGVVGRAFQPIPAPSHPSLSYPSTPHPIPIPSHPSPSQQIPSHPIPSHLIPPQPSPFQPIQAYPSVSHHIQSHPIPSQPIPAHPSPSHHRMH